MALSIDMRRECPMCPGCAAEQQLLDIIRLTGCVSQQPDSVSHQEVSHAGLASSSAVEELPGPRGAQEARGVRYTCHMVI